MEPLRIIERYYAPCTRAYEILVRHSELVAQKALEVAGRVRHLSLDVEFIREAAMLHDIGMFMTDAPELGCHGDKPYICHGYLGRELLEAAGLARHAAVCERHVGVGITAGDVRSAGLPLPERDMMPRSMEEKIISFADKFFSKDQTPEREKPLQVVRESIARYGPHKLRVFEEWAELFGY